MQIADALYILSILWLIWVIAKRMTKPKNNAASKPPKKPAERRRELKDVLPGERVRMYLYNAIPHTFTAKVLANDPQTKRICVLLNWKDRDEEKVFDYSDDAFKDFHLLNSYISKDDVADPNEQTGKADTSNVADLQSKMNKAIEAEDYETADKLQKKIDSISKKKT
jgi:hypothetical protein